MLASIVRAMLKQRLIVVVIALALVSALIAFNKVGSPQFMTWLAVPVIMGLATHAAGRGRSFRTPAIMVAALALLTQAFYPYLYGWLIGLHPAMLLVLTARNVLVFVLLGWSLVTLWRCVRRTPRVREPRAPGRQPLGDGRRCQLRGDAPESAEPAWIRDSHRDTVEESDPNQSYPN